MISLFILFFICIDCAFSYFKTNILDGRVELFCLYPGCDKFVDDSDVLRVIQKEKNLVSKFKRYQINLEISRNPNIRWCPRPECETATMILDPTDPCFSKKIVCKGCNTEFCTDCQQPWHENMSCRQHLQVIANRKNKNRGCGCTIM